MSMEMTWLEFQLSANNQNGRLWRLTFFFIQFFSEFSWNLVGLYIGFRGLWVYRHCLFSCAIQTEAIAAILILLFIFDYWHLVLEAVVSDLWTFRVTASAEVYLGAYTVFFTFYVIRRTDTLTNKTKNITFLGKVTTQYIC